MRDFLSLLYWAFVGTLACAFALAFVLSPVIIGLIVQDGNASGLWMLGLLVTIPISLAVMLYVDGI